MEPSPAATPNRPEPRGVVRHAAESLPGPWRIPAFVFAVALVLQLPYVSRLGLWSDDVVQYLQPHHAAAGDALRYVYVDATGFLSGGERPVAYLPFAAGRIAYLAGVPWLRLFAVALGALAAATAAWSARRLVDDDGFALATGVLAALWPVSAFMPSWPSAVHYSFAAILALVAGERALAGGRRSVPLAAGLHLAAALTLETFLFAAPAFVVAGLAAERLGPASGRGPERSRRLWNALAWMLAASVLVLVWRLGVVHRLGGGRLHYEDRVLTPAAAWSQAVEAPQLLLWPWHDAATAAHRAVRWTGATPAADGLALGLALLVAFVVLVFAARRFRAHSVDGESPGGLAGLRVLAPGLLLVAHWVAVLAFVPGGLARAGSFSSRLAHSALPAVAALLAGGLTALARLPRAGGRRATAWLAAALLAAAAFAGARLQSEELEAHAADWKRSGEILGRIAERCGSLAPESFVVLDSDWPSTLLGYQAAGMSHHVLSSFLVTLYDDPTLGGARLRELHASQRRVRAMHFGGPSLWFPRGSYGVVQQLAVRRLPPVERDRLVLFADDGAGALDPVPRLRIRRSRKSWLPLADNAARCVPARTAPSAAFCHALPSLCRR